MIFELACNILELMAEHVEVCMDHISCHEISGYTVRQKKLICEVCKLVHTQGYDSGLRLTPIASGNMVSVGYLCTLFSRGFGITFRSYLQLWRMQQVKKLLSKGELTIKEIAAGCGYNDSNRLRIAFKSTTGLSPRAWRERTVG